MDETTTPQAAPAAAPAPVADNADVEKNKTIAALSYILFFLPFLTDAKNSKFARFHANQSLILLIVWVAGSIVLSVIAGIIWILIPFTPLFSLAMLVLWILGLVNAFNGKMTRLPLIGNFDLIK